MKAVAKKIKDNEWIAEIYKGIVYEESDHTKYPIVSTSEIEWLEQNNWDGKGIEGVLAYHQGSYSNHRIFCLAADFNPDTTPPIHSDPAGVNVNDKLGVILINYDNDKIKIGEAIRKIRELFPTPQTGRTYTEGEVIGLLRWIRENNYKPFVTNKGAIKGWLQGGMSISRRDKDLIDEYLKQNQSHE